MTFGYSPSCIIKKFRCLKTITLWAGALGVAQSIIWMGLTIAGIIAYNCLISVPGLNSVASLVETVFFDLYFKGSCRPNEYVDYDSTILKTVSTVLDSQQILIWTCVYLAAAVCWLLFSVLLLTQVRQDNVRKSCGIIYAWVCLTLSICLMDLALGVIFGVDYGRFNIEAYNYNFNPINAGAVNPNAAQLIAGGVSAISMMIISFKGFILWFINVGLTIYLGWQATCLLRDNDGSDTLFMPRKESDDILSTRPPINAYEEHKPKNAFSNDAFVPDSHSMGTIELNQEAISRAAHMSRDSTLQDRRFRNIDSFQQYPPQRSTSPKVQSSLPNQLQETSVTTIPVPTIDYSPPMQRANYNQNGNVRTNQRY